MPTQQEYERKVTKLFREVGDKIGFDAANELFDERGLNDDNWTGQDKLQAAKSVARSVGVKCLSECDKCGELYEQTGDDMVLCGRCELMEAIAWEESKSLAQILTLKMMGACNES